MWAVAGCCCGKVSSRELEHAADNELTNLTSVSATDDADGRGLLQPYVDTSIHGRSSSSSSALRSRSSHEGGWGGLLGASSSDYITASYEGDLGAAGASSRAQGAALPPGMGGSSGGGSTGAAARVRGLEELEELGPLGVGSYSTVTMVRLRKQHRHGTMGQQQGQRGTGGGQPARVYALKTMLKQTLVDRKQTEHVRNEKAVHGLLEGCPFVCRLYCTFQDESRIHMLLELCQGGEIFSRLVACGTLDERASRFYCGCLVLAIGALHQKNVVYRDLKPENVFLEGSGYAKLGDFGFAKVLRRDATQGAAGRTFTHCGTPEYVSPEMLANTGHNHGADWWALGIFIYETLQGTTPFSAKDYSGTFKQIVRYCGDPHLPWVRGRPVSREARALIRALLEPDQASRLGNASSSADTLGAGESSLPSTASQWDAVQRHEWFGQLDWAALKDRRLPAPWSPPISHELDLSCFDTTGLDNHPLTARGARFTGDERWCAEF